MLSADEIITNIFRPCSVVLSNKLTENRNRHYRGRCVLMENRSTAANPTGTLCLIAMYDLSVTTPVNGSSTLVWKSTSDVKSKSESHDLGRTTLAMIPATPLSTMRNARHGAVPGRTVWALAAAPGIRRSSRRSSPLTLKKQRTPEIESGRLDCDARRNTARPI